MDSIFTMTMSSFMREKRPFTWSLALRLQEQILAMGVHEWDVEDYRKWDKQLEDWSDNIIEVLRVLRSLQVIVVKRRVNTPDNEDHIDG